MPVKKNVPNEPETSDRCCCSDRHEPHGLFWPIAMIIIGVVWLARNMGWFDHDVPWIPLLMIAFGVYLIVRHNARRGDKSEIRDRGKDAQ